MKRILSMILTTSLTLGISTTTLGSDYSHDVIINDSKLDLEEIHINEKEQIMLPLRTITEKLSYSVKWNGEDQSIELSKETYIIKLRIGQSKVVVNGKEIDIKNSPIVKDNTTLVPVQFFDKALDLNLGWDNDRKALKINNPTERLEKYFEVTEDEIVRRNIDDYMKLMVENQNFHGSLLVGKEDKLLINEGYGFANLEQNIMNKSQTKFAIGSVTKQFTAMAIMQLSEKGLISVDDKVSKYIPELPQGDEITIHNLLTHTSGFKNYTETIEFLKADTNNKDPMIMVNIVKDTPLEFKPGEKFEYSNTNYLLLGIIVEKTTGVTLEDYLQKNIFNPLNMKDTGVSYGRNNRTPDATPYSGFLEVHPIDDKLVLSQAYGAGNMYSTVEDLYRWERALKTEKLVSNETMNKIFENHIMFSKDEGYGYGWMIKDTNDGKKIGHGGNTFGFSSNIDRYVDKDLTVIALTNKGYYDVAELTGDIKKISLKEDYEAPEKLEEIEIKDEELYRKYVGKYKFFNDTYINISEENGNLYAQVTGQSSFEIYPQTENRFFAKSADVIIEFITNDEGEVTKLTFEQLSQSFSCDRVEDEEPIEPVDVDSEIYKEYVGDYELGLNLIVTITEQDGKIYAQLTGQDKYEIFPLSESEYYYKVVDAKISFVRDEDGNVVSLTLYQNSVEMPAPKI